MSIVLSYQNGRNLDTLERINLLSVSFGVKY